MQEKRLFDARIDAVRERLQSELKWLDNAYGRVEIRKRLLTSAQGERDTAQYGKDAKTYYYPHYYVGENEYKNLMPSDSSENMCFFYLEGRQSVTSYGISFILKGTVEVVFWVNLQTIFGDTDYRWSENIKNEILFALSGCGGVKVLAVYDEPERVYERFTLRDCIDFTMSPYYAIRVECEMEAAQACRPTQQEVVGSFDDSYDESYETNTSSEEEEDSFDDSNFSNSYD